MLPDEAQAPSNFAFLEAHEPLLARLGFQAERYYAGDPCTTLIKLRQFGEVLARSTAAHLGVTTTPQDKFADVLGRLTARGVKSDVTRLFHDLRTLGNQAAHEMAGDHSTALQQLRMARVLGQWFVKLRVDRTFQAPPFVPPPDPEKASEALRAELHRLRDELDSARAESDEQRQRALAVQAEAEKRAEEVRFWQTSAEEREQELTAEVERLARELAERPPAPVAAAEEKLAAASLDLDETDTRRLIDAQLREAGWEADSARLTHASGARPQKGRSVAIAEWPTDHGPADYVLFADMVPVAVVEAKRRNKDVAGAIEQAKRYSRGFRVSGELKDPGGPWGEYRVPFMLSANGRPFLRQIQEKCGTWFYDGRRPTNHPRALEGWYTPEGLLALLKTDEEEAHRRLATTSSRFLAELRYYQQEAIAAVERALAAGEREVMVAMATGTGKTRTCIGLVYRLVKAGLFRRVLFLVDRSALGEQAEGAFRDVRLEQMQTFHDIYEVKGLDDLVPGPATRLHISTVQGMMRRLLCRRDGDPPVPVDQYDCVVVDECHRGYNLDRDMSEVELDFRSEADYISKYRRVLDHFDAVKVGLTATPALHTVEIFGNPVYEYGLRRAVVDGFLVDHEPPIRIVTALAEDGMTWRVGEEMEVYRVQSQEIDTVHLQDEVNLELDSYNRKVLTESFNRAVCGYLAGEIDPEADGKTLVFCANDTHADMVVRLLKQAMDEEYGGIEDDAIMKITGSVDRCLEKIRLFKNEKLPNVAVTVDLLTTGIDVPEIVNLVFLRRVRSRILYEQMLGRATRPCPAIGKERFLIYDAVDLYEGMKDYTNMKPVVVDPKLTFRQLVEDLEVDREEVRRFVAEQILAKLQRKKAKIRGEDLERFTTLTGSTPEDLLEDLRRQGLDGAAAWFLGQLELADLLDRLTGDGAAYIVSHHADEVRRVERGYGSGKQRPGDYLESFRRFVRENENEIAALKVVARRPRDLTRKELKLELDRHHFRETDLVTAWRETTNEEIAASVIGFIRQAALGSPLVPYAERVDRALKRLLARHPWSRAQREWLDRIARQMKAETIVDREALDSGEFARRGGGYDRLNRIFEGRLEQVLGDLHESAWDDAQTA